MAAQAPLAELKAALAVCGMSNMGQNANRGTTQFAASQALGSLEDLAQMKYTQAEQLVKSHNEHPTTTTTLVTVHATKLARLLWLLADKKRRNKPINGHTTVTAADLDKAQAAIDAAGPNKDKSDRVKRLPKFDPLQYDD